MGGTTRGHDRTKVMALKEKVGSDWLSLMRDLAPELGEACEEFPNHVPCPMHGGQDGFRFFDDAEENGGAVCNTCGSFSDGIKLLQTLKEWTFPETCKRIEDWLDGIDDLWEDDEEAALAREQARNVKKAKEAMEAEKKKQAFLAYLEDIQDRAESGHERLAEYYRSRGLSIEPSENIGFVEEERYYERETGSQTLPAMIAIFQDKDGEPVGVLRTYLDHNGDGKADVESPKKCKSIRKGGIMGAAIRLHDPEEVLGVAEGIETAEAVFQATGTPTWATCAANRLEKFVVPAGVHEVQVWGDNDANGAGQGAARKLAHRLVEEGFRVKVLLPPEVDTDWLDVLNQDGEAAFISALDSTPFYGGSANVPVVMGANLPTILDKTSKVFSGKVVRSGDPVVELNKKHFVIRIKGHVYVATEAVNPDTGYVSMELGRVPDFLLLYRNWMIEMGKKDVPAAQIWLGSVDRREYEGVVFSPGKEVPGYYNLWLGFSVEAKQGDCSLYWEHVRTVICRDDEVHYRYVRKWLAHMVQYPRELPGVALVIRGSQGTGKNTFVDHLGDLLGPHYRMLSRIDQVTGKFTGHLQEALLVFANEAIWGGDKQGEGTLKAMVTDDWCTVEAKGKDSYQVRNYKRLIVSSNEQWAVPMGMDDRRFLVLEASDIHKEDKPYFAALSRQMKAGGLRALLYDLQHEDISNFDVRTKPHSTHGFDIKLRSAEAIDRWWYGVLHDGTMGCPADSLDEPDCWDQTPVKDKLHQKYLLDCETQKQRPIGKVQFGKNLRKLIPGYTIRETKKDGQWCHVLPTLEECREAFQQYSKSGAEIWD